jgi:hypothetical protein
MVYIDLDLDILQTQQVLRELGFDATAAALDCFLTKNSQVSVISENDTSRELMRFEYHEIFDSHTAC